MKGVDQAMPEWRAFVSSGWKVWSCLWRYFGRTEVQTRPCLRREFLCPQDGRCGPGLCLRGELLCPQDGRCGHAWQDRCKDQAMPVERVQDGRCGLGQALGECSSVVRPEVQTRSGMRREFLCPKDGKSGPAHSWGHSRWTLRFALSSQKSRSINM
jgi:hypothetical protein